MIDIEIDKSIVKRSNQTWSKEAQLFIAVEELSELIQSVSKARREKPGCRENLIEEIADCYIAIEILKDQFEIYDKEIEAVIKCKQQGLDEKMDLQYMRKEASANKVSNLNYIPNIVYSYECTDLPPWYVVVHSSDSSEYFMNVRAVKNVKLTIENENSSGPIIMSVSIVGEAENKSIVGDDIFTILVKMERFSDVDVEPIVEDIYFDGPADIRDNYNFRSLYRKFNLDIRDQLFPDGMK